MCEEKTHLVICVSKGKRFRWRTENEGGTKGEIGRDGIWNEPSHVTLNLDLTSASPRRGRERGEGLGARFETPERKAIRSNPAEREQVTPVPR